MINLAAILYKSRESDKDVGKGVILRSDKIESTSFFPQEFRYIIQKIASFNSLLGTFIK